MGGLNSLGVIYASEGTGHRAAALAICEAFCERSPHGRVICRDILDFIPSWLKFTVSRGYVAMARHAPRLWGAMYWGSDRAGVQAEMSDRVHNWLCGVYLPRIEREMTAEGVGAVVFTHYFGAAPFAERMRGRMPVYCADTDFASHRFQRSAAFALSFAGSARALRQRTDEGILNAACTGVPVALKYSRLPSREEARAKLSLPPEARVVLASGGGIGAGSVFAAVKSLAQLRDTITAAICGNNDGLYAEMRAYFHYKENVRVEGFVPNMEDYYAAADAAVMKPGGLSSSEALCAALPMLLIDPVPGQEELNLSYLTENGAARYLPRAELAAEGVGAILSNGGAQQMRAAAKKLARPNAAREIIRLVAENI
ncbi:glycosyltransferase [Synergistes jonesii]|uniref:glycosyltransferase n=1 Tax=Synergistes jonesii TaxID=2754 RepID=UPI00248DAFBB|nr:glycosyltransferase [Synergistes jonesii]